MKKVFICLFLWTSVANMAYAGDIQYGYDSRGDYVPILVGKH